MTERRPLGRLLHAAPLLVAAGCATAAVIPEPADPGAPAPSPPEDACPATPGQQVVEGLNHRRAERGLPSLLVDSRLVRAAEEHAADLARTGASGHRGSDGSLPDIRVDEAGYRWTFVAENVAVGQASAADVVAGWMRSADHRTNVHASEALHVGVGYVHRPGSEWRHYWTAVFGASSTLARPPGGCNP